MNKILTTLLGTSLLTATLYAGQNSCTNHSNGCKAYSKCDTTMKKNNNSCNFEDKTTSNNYFNSEFERLVHEETQEGS